MIDRKIDTDRHRGLNKIPKVHNFYVLALVSRWWFFGQRRCHKVSPFLGPCRAGEDGPSLRGESLRRPPPFLMLSATGCAPGTLKGQLAEYEVPLSGQACERKNTKHQNKKFKVLCGIIRRRQQQQIYFIGCCFSVLSYPRHVSP